MNKAVSKHVTVLLLLILMSVSSSAQFPRLHIKWKFSAGIIYRSAIDKEGNTYAFLEADTINGQPMSALPGRFCLVKLNAEGQVVWFRKFGMSGILPTPNDGTITIDNNNDVIIGAAGYFDTIYYDRKIVSIIPHNSESDERPYYLKVTSDGNLLYVKYFQNTHDAYFTKLIVDRDNNIYSNLVINGSLELSNDTIKNLGYNFVLLKISPEGDVLWNKYIHPIDTPLSQIAAAAANLILYKPGENCPEQILITTDATKNIYVDNNSIYSKPISAKSCSALIEFDTYGNIVRSRGFAGDGNILSIENVEDRIFIGGYVTDSAFIPGVKPIVNSIPYVAELDDLFQIRKAVTIPANTLAEQLKFNLKYGLVACAVGQFSNFNSDLESQEVKFIPGGTFEIINYAFYDDDMIGAANYFETNYFDNDTLITTKTNIKAVIFRSMPFNQLSWKIDEIVATGLVFPHPFHEQCTVRFNFPLYAYSYNIYNNIGQLCHKATITLENGTDLKIDMNNLAAGLYFLRLKNCCDKQVIVKLVKL